MLKLRGGEEGKGYKELHAQCDVGDFVERRREEKNDWI